MLFDIASEHADQEVGADPSARGGGGSAGPGGRTPSSSGTPSRPGPVSCRFRRRRRTSALPSHWSERRRIRPKPPRRRYFAFALPEEGSRSDPQIEMLPHLALSEGALGAAPDRVRVPERALVPADRAADLDQILRRRRDQVLALAGPLFGQQGVPADDQPLAGEQLPGSCFKCSAKCFH